MYQRVVRRLATNSRNWYWVMIILLMSYANVLLRLPLFKTSAGNIIWFNSNDTFGTPLKRMIEGIEYNPGKNVRNEPKFLMVRFHIFIFSDSIYIWEYSYAGCVLLVFHMIFYYNNLRRTKLVLEKLIFYSTSCSLIIEKKCQMVALLPHR